MTDLDGDGKPVINLSNVKFKKTLDGRAKISMSEVIDYGDIEMPINNTKVLHLINR